MHGRTWRRLAGSAGAIAALGLAGGVTPAQAAVSCQMNVVISVPSPYAATYNDQMTIDIRSKEGRTLGALKAELYTFKGRKLASGTRKGRIGGEGSGSIKMRLRYPMQAGKLTVVVQEVRRAGCGNPKKTRVLTLRGCPGALPVSITRFSDLTVGAESFSDVIGAKGGAFLRNITSKLYDPSSQLVGEASLDVLFGRQTLDHQLATPLVSGFYTQVLHADVDGLPKACPGIYQQVKIKVP